MREKSSVMVEATPNDSQYYMRLEEKYGAFNYAPMPVVLARGKGTKVSIDQSFLSGRGGRFVSG